MKQFARSLVWTAAAALVAGIARPAAAAPLQASTYLTYSGKASSLGSDRFLYGEEHFVGFRAGRIAERVVLYKCGNGLPFARKILAPGNHAIWEKHIPLYLSISLLYIALYIIFINWRFRKSDL